MTKSVLYFIQRTFLNPEGMDQLFTATMRRKTTQITEKIGKKVMSQSDIMVRY